MGFSAYATGYAPAPLSPEQVVELREVIAPTVAKFTWLCEEPTLELDEQGLRFFTKLARDDRDEQARELMQFIEVARVISSRTAALLWCIEDDDELLDAMLRVHPLWLQSGRAVDGAKPKGRHQESTRHPALAKTDWLMLDMLSVYGCIPSEMVPEVQPV